MCSICGFALDDAQRRVAPDVLGKMSATLAHRGPDDQGQYQQGPVGLASNRLAIIDLDTGRQPIANEDQTIWVIQNGEIYNYPTLNQMLKRRGHHLATKSDTETLVHAYEEFGDEFLDHLNGIFALAVWDGPRNRLLLARDRSGVKPLYYTVCNGALVFASELKAILEFPGVERNIDLVALGEYLSFEYVPTPRTIFQNIAKLEPGHVLTWQNGRLRIRQYWDFHLERSEGGQVPSLDGICRELRTTLAESVDKEMVSDVEVGALLSGGVDSSAVAAMMAQASGRQLKTFSIAFDEPSFDESKYARQVASKLGAKHHELVLRPEHALSLVEKTPEFMDEPFGDSSLIPTYLLSEFAGSHVKVVLSGDGGDELFAGYPTMTAHRLVQYYERLLPKSFRHRFIPALAERMPVSFDNISLDFKVKRFLAGRGVPEVVRHHQWLGSFNAAQRGALLNGWASMSEKDAYDPAYGHFNACRAAESMNRYMYCDFKLYLEGDILVKVDRASMAHGLEVRVPLLNPTMLGLVERIPLKLKLKGLKTKYVFKRALEGVLPSGVLKRPKKGFNMPVAHWLSGPFRDLVGDLLAADRLRSQGLFDPEYVSGLLVDHQQQRQDHRKLLWTLLSFQLWHERWA